jgi:hypothetical protein
LFKNSGCKEIDVEPIAAKIVKRKNRDGCSEENKK